MSKTCKLVHVDSINDNAMPRKCKGMPLNLEVECPGRVKSDDLQNRIH